MKVRIWSVERSAWWRPNGHGYTKSKAESGLVIDDYAEAPRHVLVPLESKVRFATTVTKKETAGACTTPAEVEGRSK